MKILNINGQEDVMKKILIIAAVVQAGVLLAAHSYGASDNCTVVKTEKNQLILNCGKKADQFQVNDKIKIKSMRKKSIEGC